MTRKKNRFTNEYNEMTFTIGLKINTITQNFIRCETLSAGTKSTTFIFITLIKMRNKFKCVNYFHPRASCSLSRL